jgi:hypothetical protein
MVLTLATTGLFIVFFIRSFGMTSRALPLSAFNMDVTVASRLAAHHLEREDRR